MNMDEELRLLRHIEALIAERDGLKLQLGEARAEIKRLHDGHGYKSGLGACVCGWCMEKRIDLPQKIQGCGVCGSKLVTIRGKIPKTPDREVCACCAVEKLEEIEFQARMREQGPAQAAP